MERMYAAQLALQRKLGYDTACMTPKECTQYAKDMALMLIQELNESLYELPWFKPWKDYNSQTIEEHAAKYAAAHGEAIDTWCFFMNYMYAIGLTPAALERLYYAKLDENMQKELFND